MYADPSPGVHLDRWIRPGRAVTGVAQDRTEREVVELIVRDGPAGEGHPRRDRKSRGASSSRASRIRTLASRTAGRARASPSFFRPSNCCRFSAPATALSRAGVAATAAAEADRDVRLWLLRSDAAAAVARLVAGQSRLEAAQSHTRDVERLIEILRTREREGEGSRFDRLRAEQELRDTRQIVTSAERLRLPEARAALSGMLPRDVTLTLRRRRADRAAAARCAAEALIDARNVDARRAARASAVCATRDLEAEAARRCAVSRLRLCSVDVKRADDRFWP